VTLGPGGTFAYVSNAGSASVAAIELKTGAVTLIATPERPEGSVLSPDGKFLYVACRVGNRIAIIDTAGNKLVGEIVTGKEPVRLGRTPDGTRLVWALHGDNGVEIGDPAGRRVITRVPLGGKAVSLNLSPDGKVAYAAAQYDDTVYGVSVDEGRIIREFKTAKGAGPDPVMEWTGK
jgi:YVTN family beta-propeller protein